MNIKSASDLLGISADTIRYYERVGLVPPITRTSTGIRDFQDQDIEALEFIKCFRSAGVSVDSLVDYMSLFQKVAFSSVDAHGVALRLLPSVYVAHDCFDWCPLRW